MEQWVTWAWDNIGYIGPWLATMLVSGGISEGVERILKSEAPPWARRAQDLALPMCGVAIGAFLTPMESLSALNNVLYFSSATTVGLFIIDVIKALVKKWWGINLSSPGDES